jgi:hypothetical protein
VIGRRLTTAGTLAALCVVLVVMTIWGVKSATAPLPSLNTSSEPTCSANEVDVQKYVYRKDITVSVYNAGGRQGLAGDTMARFESRSFQAGEVGNAPTGTKVARAEVRTTKQDDPAAQLVAENLGTNVPIVVSEDEMGPGIDVFVGKTFRHLKTDGPSRLKLAAPVTHCVPVT